MQNWKIHDTHTPTTSNKKCGCTVLTCKKAPLNIPKIIKSDSISESFWKWHIEPISQAELELAVSSIHSNGSVKRRPNHLENGNLGVA